MSELMTVEELGQYLRFTKKTIYKLLKQGSIPSFKIGNKWRFDKAAIDTWLQKSMERTKVNIIVVDDENVIRTLFKDTLESLGHRVITAKTSDEGLELVKQDDFDLVFLDIKLPGINGAELFKQIKAIDPSIRVTIITGYPESEIMARALAYGPFGVMNKPFSESDIISAVNAFLRSTTAEHLIQ